MNTKRRVGVYTEHVTVILHACGCRREHVTLHPMLGPEVRVQRLKDCPKCELNKLLEVTV